MEQFTKPEIEIIEFEVEDIVTATSGDPCADRSYGTEYHVYGVC